MRGDTFIHAGKKPFIFEASCDLREDQSESYALKITDEESNIRIFFENKREVRKLIEELKKIL